METGGYDNVDRFAMQRALLKQIKELLHTIEGGYITLTKKYGQDTVLGVMTRLKVDEKAVERYLNDPTNERDIAFVSNTLRDARDLLRDDVRPVSHDEYSDITTMQENLEYLLSIIKRGIDMLADKSSKVRKRGEQGGASIQTKLIDTRLGEFRNVEESLVMMIEHLEEVCKQRAQADMTSINQKYANVYEEVNRYIARLDILLYGRQ